MSIRNELLEKILAATSDGGVTIQDELRLVSTEVAQLPSGLDVVMPVNFNPTNETSAGGNISYNATTNKFTFKKGVYRSSILISYGRTGGAGESDLFWVGRTGPAGLEVEGDNSLFAKLDSDKVGIPASISSLIEITVDDTELDFALWRDSGGDNSGGLYQHVPTRAGATTAASASSTIQKIG